MAITKHVKHIRSSVADSIPTTEQLDYGEIAINYSADTERLFIKNANNEIVPFYSGKVIEENEQVTAAALTDLDSRINDIEENNVNTENMESVTYSELKSKRNNGELVSGKHYRITDYVTTTSQENTQSAGHQFDVVVLALDESTLSENAHAMLHDGDTYFSTNGADLSAWELKYCLDNDKSRFAWAVSANHTIEPYDNALRGCKLVECRKVGDELRLYKNYRSPEPDEVNLTDEDEYFVYVGTLDYEENTYYAWQKKDLTNYSSLILTETLYQPGAITPNAEPSYVISIDYSDVSDGQGVIYYMKDEWDNECPYDFKNIQFKRWAVTDVENAKLNDTTLTKFKQTFKYDEQSNNFTTRYAFKNSGINTGFTNFIVDANNYGWYYTFSTIKLENESFDFSNIEDASIKGNNFYNDIGSAGCFGNIIKPYYDNMASEHDGIDGSQYLNNIVFNGFYAASDGGYAYHAFANSIEYNSKDNTFGYYSRYNTFGNGCLFNIFGDECSSNTFGDNCRENASAYCWDNTFGNNCSSNTFGHTYGLNILGNNCTFNTFGNNCIHNTFGGSCTLNTFGNYLQYNSFGHLVNHVTFSKDYICYVIVENGNKYITLTSTETTSFGNPLRNITIAQGVNNTTVNKNISHDSTNDTFKTTYQPANSVVVNV